ncbi:MAG: zinc ribbon domain-containing protein [Deltaproteobacteria bacterium]|nr:zinc ribbon domain-containing protein [Deltaproteobacteria bacterium]
MFFLIGGIQPRTVTLDDAKRLCASCGLAQARLKRIDHYLSLFFIPLILIKRGQPLLMCERCGFVSSPEGPGERPLPISRTELDKKNCQKCGSPMESSFRYCPHCGAPNN